MASRKTVRIDALPESAWRYSGYDAIVCVDVLLSSTTLVTGLSQGRRVFVAQDAAAAAQVGASLKDPVLLTDSLAGRARELPFGGPAWLSAQQSKSRTGPLVLASPLAQMLTTAAKTASAYVACLRNLEATANELSLQHRRVVLISAGEDGEVCAADQMAAAWLALRLQGRDFELEGRNTSAEVARWAPSDVALISLSRSAERLRMRDGQQELDFVLHHVNDLEVVCAYGGGELHDPVAVRKLSAQETPTPAWGTHSATPIGRD